VQCVTKGDIYGTDLPESDGLEVGLKFDTLEKFCKEEATACEQIAFKQLTRDVNRERFVVRLRFVEEGPVDGDIVTLR
jgi:hypothetical protein